MSVLKRRLQYDPKRYQPHIMMGFGRATPICNWVSVSLAGGSGARYSSSAWCSWTLDVAEFLPVDGFVVDCFLFVIESGVLSLLLVL